MFFFTQKSVCLTMAFPIVLEAVQDAEEAAQDTED